MSIIIGCTIKVDTRVTVVFFIFFVISIIGLSSCKNDKSRACDKIDQLIKKEPKSDSEFDFFYNLVLKNSECLDSLMIAKGILANDVIDEFKLKEYYFNSNKSVREEKKIKVNIFL